MMNNVFFVGKLKIIFKKENMNIKKYKIHM